MFGIVLKVYSTPALAKILVAQGFQMKGIEKVLSGDVVCLFPIFFSKFVMFGQIP